MPAKLSWSDTLNCIVVPDTISYKLPKGVSIDRAPNQIEIDGFGTLPMQRTRVSVHNNELFHMVDDTVRNPLRAQVVSANTPAPLAPHAASARQALPQAPAVPLGPALGIGAGNADRDTPLYTLGRMLLFGMSVAAVAVGSCLIGASPIVAACLLAGGTIGMLITLAGNPYHIIGPVPAAEAARAARVAEADFQDALA